MTNIRPILLVETGRPDYYGRVSKRAYGMDLPFQPPPDNPAQSMRGLRTARMPRRRQWSYTDAVRIPEAGVTIRPQALEESETTARWTPNAYLREVRPWGETYDWVEWPGRESNGGPWTSTFSLAADQPFRLKLRLGAVTSAARTLQLILGWNNAVGHVFRMSEALDEVAVRTPAGVVHPMQSGAWRTAMQRGCREPRTLELMFLPLGDDLIVYLEGVDTPLVYHETDLTLAAGPVYLYVGGERVAWHLVPQTYADDAGVVEQTEQYAVDTAIWNLPTLYRFFRTEPGGTDAAMDLQPVGSTIRPKITLTSTMRHRTPVVYMAQVWSEPTLTTPTGLTLTDLTAGLAGESLTIDYQEHRGHTAELTVRDEAAAYTIWQNGVLTVRGLWDTGAGGVPTALLFEGRISAPQSVLQGGKLRGHLVWHLQATSPAEVLGRRKTLIRMPSFGGWTVGAAVNLLLQNAGWTAGRIAVDAAVADVVLPGWFDEQRFLYDARTTVARALDEMTAAVGCRWYERVWGTYAIVVERKPSYAGVYDATLSDSDSTRAEIVTECTYHEDLEDFANFVWVEAQEKDGSGLPAFCGDRPSIETPSDDHFVGDWLERVELVPDAHVPELYARQIYNEGAERSGILETDWHQWHPAVHPGSYLRAQISASNPQVPADTIFRVTQTRVTFDFGADRISAKQRLTAVRETWT